MRIELEELLKHKVWYAIKDQEPIDLVDCLVTDGEYVGFMDFRWGCPESHSTELLGRLTHWMPLPELPKD